MNFHFVFPLSWLNLGWHVEIMWINNEDRSLKYLQIMKLTINVLKKFKFDEFDFFCWITFEILHLLISKFRFYIRFALNPEKNLDYLNILILGEHAVLCVMSEYFREFWDIHWIIWFIQIKDKLGLV